MVPRDFRQGVSMPEVVEATCPYCKKLVRIPVEWIHQPMRCKHCRQVFQAKQPPASASSAASPVRRTPVPPQVLRSIPVNPGQVPLAAGPPVSIASPAGAMVLPRAGKGWWLGAAVAGVVLITAGVLVGVLWHRITGLTVGGSQGRDEGGIAKLIDPTKQFKPSPAGTYPVTVTTRAWDTRARTAAVPVQGATKSVGPPVPKTGPTVPAPDKERPQTSGKLESPQNDPPTKTKVAGNTSPGNPMRTAAGGLFPRRVLAISVSNYLLANPLNYGGPREKGFPGSSVRAALNDFGNFVMKFPNTQLFELSDAAPRDRHPAVKSVMEAAITDFLGSAAPRIAW